MLIFWDAKVAACIGNCRNTCTGVKIANGQVRVYESEYGISDNNCTTSSHNGCLLYRRSKV